MNGQERKPRSVFGTVKRLLPRNQESSRMRMWIFIINFYTVQIVIIIIAEVKPPRRRAQEEQHEDVFGRRNNTGEGSHRKGDGTGDHASNHQLLVVNSSSNTIADQERRGEAPMNNVRQKNVSIKRSKSQRSSTSLVRIPCSKRKSAIDSPIRKLNNKLTHALLQSRQSNKFYKQELDNLQGMIQTVKIVCNKSLLII